MTDSNTPTNTPQPDDELPAVDVRSFMPTGNADSAKLKVSDILRQAGVKALVKGGAPVTVKADGTPLPANSRTRYAGRIKAAQAVLKAHKAGSTAMVYDIHRAGSMSQEGSSKWARAVLFVTRK